METESFKNNNFGKNLRRHRLMRNMSTGELSKLTGIPTSNLAVMESGERIPKLDKCLEFARVMDADPVEMCGIELSEQDEKRLLMKLLKKYATNVNVLDDKVEAELPIDFAGFGLMINDLDRLKTALQSSLRDKASSDEFMRTVAAKLNYWLDMYPVYDAYRLSKIKVGDNPSMNDVKEWYDISKDEFDIESSEYIVKNGV